MRRAFRRAAGTLALAALAMAGCGPTRQEVLDGAPAQITYSAPHTVSAPKLRWADKYGIADFGTVGEGRCDGVEDLIEVDDKGIFRQRYEARVYPGFKNDDGLLQFSDGYFDVSIPLKRDWLTNETKIDTAYLPGDRCADIIFTNYDTGWSRDSVHVSAAINDGTGRAFTLQEPVGAKFEVDEQMSDCVVGSSDDHDIEDDLMIDWSDIDGDRYDDLGIFCDYGSRQDLIMEVRRSAVDRQGRWALAAPLTATLPRYMTGVSIRNLDTQDYDGDGKGDLFLHKRRGGEMTFSTALGHSTESALSFTPQRDSVNANVYSWFGFSRRFVKDDTFDGNFDGRADYVQLGKKDGKGILVYQFSLPVTPEGLMQDLGQR